MVTPFVASGGLDESIEGIGDSSADRQSIRADGEVDRSLKMVDETLMPTDLEGTCAG